MARDPKLEVAAVNIRIPDDKARDYSALIKLLAKVRRGVRVYGDSYLAISHFEGDKGLGVFSKYTEIDIDGDWFDLDDFDTAAPEKLDEILIPENLRPNHGKFYFKLDTNLHVIAFSSYAESKGLSARSVEKYFSEALMWPDVQKQFGRVEADVIKSYAEVEKILALDDLKELHLIIRRPNADDIDKDLAKVIEERLKQQNADEYEETLKAKGAHDLKPNRRTRNLAQLAAENGQVRAKSIVNGVLTDQETSEAPLTEVTTYKADQAELPIFLKLSDRIFGQIKAARARLVKE